MGIESETSSSSPSKFFSNLAKGAVSLLPVLSTLVVRFLGEKEASGGWPWATVISLRMSSSRGEREERSFDRRGDDTGEFVFDESGDRRADAGGASISPSSFISGLPEQSPSASSLLRGWPTQ